MSHRLRPVPEDPLLTDRLARMNAKLAAKVTAVAIKQEIDPQEDLLGWYRTSDWRLDCQNGPYRIERFVDEDSRKELFRCLRLTGQGEWYWHWTTVGSERAALSECEADHQKRQTDPRGTS